MANLLPPAAKENLRRDRATRLASFGAVALLAAGGLALLALTPSYIVLKMQESQGTNAIATQTPEIVAAKSDLARAQSVVTQIAPLATSTVFLDALNEVLENRPRGMSLDTISYAKAANGGKGQIVVAGTSAGREAINTYRIALEKDARFDAVSVPVSALAGAQDGHFTITLTGSF